MKPSDIYEAPACSRRTDNLHVIGRLMPEVDLHDDGIDGQDRVVLVTHYDPYIDGDRNATLYSVRYQDRPFMVCKTGGRPDYEHYGRYITDLPTYREATAYLKSLEKVDEPERDDVVDRDADIPGLDVVYGTKISLADLGRVAQARQWIRKWLVEWPHLHPWPYPCDFEHDPTLSDKQERRWPRIRAEVERHLEADPAAVEVAAIAKANERGSDAVVAEMLRILEALPPERGSGREPEGGP